MPLRKLIYRVLPLPPSMYQFVYDFGTVNEKTEDDYIRRIVINEVCEYDCFYSPSFVITQLSKCDFVTCSENTIHFVVSVLCQCQKFMRSQKVIDI